MPKMAALEEEFTLSAVPLGAGPDGLLGVEQCDKTDQFLITDSGRTVILYKVMPIGPSSSLRRGRWGRSAPLPSCPLLGAEPEPGVSSSFREKSSGGVIAGSQRGSPGTLPEAGIGGGGFSRRERRLSELHSAKRLSARGPDSERKPVLWPGAPGGTRPRQVPSWGLCQPVCPLKCWNGAPSGGRG